MFSYIVSFFGSFFSLIHSVIVKFAFHSILSPIFKELIHLIGSFIDYVLIFVFCALFVMFVTSIVLLAFAGYNNKPKPESFKPFLIKFFEEQSKREKTMFDKEKDRVEKTNNLRSAVGMESIKPKPKKGIFDKLFIDVEQMVTSKGLEYFINKEMNLEVMDLWVAQLGIITRTNEPDAKSIFFIGFLNRWFSPLDFQKFYPFTSKNNTVKKEKIIHKKGKVI